MSNTLKASIRSLLDNNKEELIEKCKNWLACCGYTNIKNGIFTYDKKSITSCDIICEYYNYKKNKNEQRYIIVKNKNVGFVLDDEVKYKNSNKWYVAILKDHDNFDLWHYKDLVFSKTPVLKIFSYKIKNSQNFHNAAERRANDSSVQLYTPNKTLGLIIGDEPGTKIKLFIKLINYADNNHLAVNEQLYKLDENLKKLFNNFPGYKIKNECTFKLFELYGALLHNIVKN